MEKEKRNSTQIRVSQPLARNEGRYWSDTALVLRTADWQEMDRLVTLYTQTAGKIRVVAKGARKSGNRFGSSLEPATIGKFSFYSGRGWPILSQSEIRVSFRHLISEPRRFLAVHYLLFLINDSIEEEFPDAAFFSHLCYFLELIAGTGMIDSILTRFRCDLLAYLGVEPRTNECSRCGQPAKNSTCWDGFSGGVICDSCNENKRGILLFRDTAMILRVMVSASRREALRLRLTSRQVVDVDRLLADYYSFHVHEGLPSWQAFLQKYQGKTSNVI